ncbi:hypothetical protein Aple_018900 [Acrocarpospora pleiomorpha]|uniref:Uncharacterized protein n=1 Tax=Acrocarpospora pleiomorpha TaxID=90975 RepID=A0A5M3XBE3_9ACTN|nr:hypothetical protein [Acrocarpospora pleiomorpha]GES18995.1 hypothetical protein Aple_018900 [Acrocarpospora pleiomorpha]
MDPSWNPNQYGGRVRGRDSVIIAAWVGAASAVIVSLINLVPLFFRNEAQGPSPSAGVVTPSPGKMAVVLSPEPSQSTLTPLPSHSPELPVETPSPAIDPALSESWLRHDDPEHGFSIRLPRGWRVVEKKRSVVAFNAMSGPRCLYVDQTWEASTDLRSWAESVAADWARREGVPLNQRFIKTTYKGRPALDWEFTYRRGGETLRVIDRFFRADGGSVALMYTGVLSTWESEDVVIHEKLMRTFRLH